MAYGSDGLSASDVALLTGNKNDSNGWGGEGGAWWIIIFLIFAFLGFGRNGNGFGGNGGSDNPYAWSPCCTPATQQGLSDAFNFSQLDNGVRSMQNGICDGFYSINSSIANLGSSILQCCLKIKNFIGNHIRNNMQAILA